MSYLLIPNLRVQHANMASSNYALTVAQPLAFALFTHALGRLTGSKLNEVAILYHEVQPLGEEAFDFAPQQRRGATFIDKSDYASGSKGLNLSLQPVATMHLRASVVIRFEGKAPKYIERALSTMRLAGGTILGFDQPLISESLEDLPALKGYWLIERSDLVDPESPIDSFLAACSSKAPGHGWLAGATLGYAMTTPYSSDRVGVRSTEESDTYPHAFCEPLVGMTQFASARLIAGSKDLPFWSPHWVQDDIFVIKNNFDEFELLVKPDKASAPEFV